MTDSTVASKRSFISALNGRYHRVALNTFMVIVLAHWAEHLVQAYQIWVLGWPRPKSLGALGAVFPALVSSEWLHYGYAIVMLVALFMLRSGFAGRAHGWWVAALVIQFWHHIEHFVLLIQALAGHNFFGKAVPTSFLQLIYPRVELHLVYNSIVFIPMMIAIYYHLRPNQVELQAVTCHCARPRHTAVAAAA